MQSEGGRVGMVPQRRTKRKAPVIHSGHDTPGGARLDTGLSDLSSPCDAVGVHKDNSDQCLVGSNLPYLCIICILY